MHPSINRSCFIKRRILPFATAAWQSKRSRRNNENAYSCNFGNDDAPKAVARCSPGQKGPARRSGPARSSTRTRNKVLLSILLRMISFTGLGVLVACGPNVYDEIELMPAPTVYADTGASPFENVTRENVADRAKLFYVTDRMPAGAEDPQAYYNNERGHMLRAGTARVKIDPALATWEEISRVTLMNQRDRTYIYPEIVRSRRDRCSSVQPEPLFR